MSPAPPAGLAPAATGGRAAGIAADDQGPGLAAGRPPDIAPGGSAPGPIAGPIAGLDAGGTTWGPPESTDPRTAAILATRTRQLAGRGVAAAGPAPLPLLACAVGTETYGLPLDAILRVIPCGPCTATPGMPPAMLGLCSHAGQVFIVLDLGTMLHGQAAPGATPPGTTGPDAPAPHLLLLRQGPRRFALRVGRALGAILAVPLAGPVPLETGAPPGAIAGHALAQDTAGETPRAGAAGWPAAAPGAPAGGGLVGLIDIGRLLQPYLPGASPPPALTPALVPALPAPAPPAATPPAATGA